MNWYGGLPIELVASKFAEGKVLYLEQSSRPGALQLDDYQRKARLSDQNLRVATDGLRIPLLGLFGEMGSLLTIPKREERETSTYQRDALLEEFGDVLWYLSNLASRQKIALSALARAGLERDTAPHTAIPSLRFQDLQHARSNAPRKGKKSIENDYFALGGAVGRLISEFSMGEHWELDRSEFLRHLARTFQMLVRAANNSGLSLTLAAQNNLAKIQSRWPSKRVYLKPFDQNYEKYEQVPRHIEMYFDERTIGGNTYVYQSCNGINIGDRLTDNKGEEDDYRFHDVFHLAYLAILGWSPVMRALLKVKRKSRPSVDENQDGARAIIIEEGIATWIFNHGLDHHYFRYVKKLDYSLLKAVRTLVAGYEVERCPLWQWEEAILEGFRVFRLLRRKRRGWIVADFKAHSISYSETQPQH